jgi:transcriptional regulator with XRE-family HTH domain
MALNRRKRRVVVDPLVRALRVERERQGISQRQLAEMMGASATWVWQAEVGEVAPGIIHLRRYATALGKDFALRPCIDSGAPLKLTTQGQPSEQRT